MTYKPLSLFLLLTYQSLATANNACLQLQSAPELQKIRPSSSQIIVAEHREGIQAKISLCQWQDSAWQPVYTEPFPAVIGKNGIAGIGEKKEGDLKTPAGLYPIGVTFGSKPLALKMDYRYITADDKFIDDVKSPQYNTWVFGQTEAKSYEPMLIDLYALGAVINYNMQPIVPGAGSAIFIHLWRTNNSPTAGCIALPKEALSKLLNWLDKSQHPYIFILA